MAFVIKNTGFSDKMPFKMQFYDKNYILKGIFAVQNSWQNFERFCH